MLILRQLYTKMVFLYHNRVYYYSYREILCKGERIEYDERSNKTSGNGTVCH